MTSPLQNDNIIYLDSNATSAVDPQVVEAMIPYLTDNWGNPSSLHIVGQRARKGLTKAREQVARLLGATPEEIIFTSCGTESDSTAIANAVAALPERKHIITSAVEHLAVLEACRALKSRGYRITEIGVDEQGRWDWEAYHAALDEDTALVAVMWANNETGVVFPVEEIAQEAKKVGALVHVDAVQVAGKMTIDMSQSCIDTLAISGHKFHAPKGVGALYVREGTPFTPFLRGGHQEKNRRAGTENMASIVGMGEAAEVALSYIADEETRIAALRDNLQQRLSEAIPEAVVLGAEAPRTPNTLNIAFPYIAEDAILQELSEYGICASSGSACNSRTLDPSHVLEAMGVPAHISNGSIRFSLSRFNTERDIDAVVSVLPGIIARLSTDTIAID